MPFPILGFPQLLCPTRNQLDRALPSEGKGQKFESSRARHSFVAFCIGWKSWKPTMMIARSVGIQSKVKLLGPKQHSLDHSDLHRAA
jgi:hypothetical protein